MLSNSNSDEFKFPEHLNSLGELREAFDQYCKNKSSTDKGLEFARIVCKIIPLLSFGSEYNDPEINLKKSGDRGIDIHAKSLDERRTLYVQSKYSIREKTELDSIVSLFKAFHEEHYSLESNSTPLFSLLNLPFSEEDQDVYAIFTLSKLDNIREKYVESKLSSTDFFKFLKDRKQIYLVDGEEILKLLRKLFEREYKKANSVILSLISKPLRVEDVYVGIASANAIKSCHDQIGNSIFLENVRPYLGESSGKKKVADNRSYVNTLIAKTLVENPDKFLARNNGIVFRASSIEAIDENTLRLTDASIINGCQTTTRIVENPSDQAFVVTKIVQASDSWDIAKAANFQNYIDVIDLEIACIARPQVVEEMIARVGVSYDSYSPFVILETSHEKRATYLRFRALCIGIFSKTPMNILSSNYTELNDDLIDEFYNAISQVRKERIFELIILLYVATEVTHQRAIEKFSKRNYGSIYKRFWSEEKFKYRMIFGILSACGVVKQNIYEAPPKLLALEGFLTEIEQTLLEVISKSDGSSEASDSFLNQYNYAFKAVAIKAMETERDEREILQTMTKAIERARFDNLYNLMELMAE